MPGIQPSLFSRDDTFLGVCEALGEDFGFNPLYLRVTLGVLILWNPAMVIGAYLALGAIVALSRWVYPSRSSDAVDRKRPSLKAENDEPWSAAAAA